MCSSVTLGLLDFVSVSLDIEASLKPAAFPLNLPYMVQNKMVVKSNICLVDATPYWDVELEFTCVFCSVYDNAVYKYTVNSIHVFKIDINLFCSVIGV